MRISDSVKDEYDTASQETVPRKYFSGGAALDRAVLSNDDVSKSEITRTIGQITKLLAVPITVFALDKDGNTQEITDSVKVPNVLEEFEDSTNNLININQDTIKHKLDSVGVVPDTDNFPFVVFPKIKLDNNEAMFILQIGDKNKEYMLLTGDEKENDFENLEMKSLTIDGKKIGDIQFEQRYRLLNDQKLFPGTQFVLKNANDTSRFYIFNEDGEGKEITKAELKRNIENWSREKKRVAEQLSFDRDSTQNKKAVNKQLIVDFSSSGQLGYFNELNLSGPFTFNNMFKVIPYIGFGSTKEFGGDRPHIKATGEIELNLENFYGQLGLNFVKGFYLDQGNNEPYYKEGKSFEVLVGPKFSFNKKDGPGSLFTYAGYKEGIIKQYADWYRGELERKKRWAVGIDAHQYKDKKEFTQGMIEFFSNDNPYSQFLTNMGVNVNYSHTDFFGDNSLQFGINSRISADESFGTIMAKLQLNKFGFDIKPTIASRFDRLDYGVDGNMEFYLPITDLMMQFGIAGGWSKDLGGHIAFNILGLAKGKYGTGLPGISRADITVSNQRNIKNSYGYVGATSYVFGYRNPVRPEFSSIYLDNFNVFFPETAANLRFLTLDNYLKSLNFSIKQGDKLLEEINEFENEGEGGGIKELSIGEQKLSKLLELKMEVYKADFQADWENMREETLFIEILNGSPRAHKAYENLKKDTDKLLVPEVIRNKISEKSRKADRAKGADKAMLNNPGGIDLNPEIGTVSVDSDQKFEWNIDPNYRPLDNIPMDGLMHQIIIINPVPLQTIPLMLGLSTEDDQEPAQVVSAQLSMN
ncbi:MAG: hypothetical protein KBD53_10595, partial [Candidatus Omnitrophica bacterium]|nr:hypothetical protein [Candidatus Omnitrophota bacterium]